MKVGTRLATFGQLSSEIQKASMYSDMTNPVFLESISEMRVVDIACGEKHSMMLTKDGRLFVCGSDEEGQLGEMLLHCARYKV